MNIYSPKMKLQQDARSAAAHVNIGVLALQGCITPHRSHIEALGATYKEVRTREDLESIHGLILPGGESTTMLKLINEFELEESLKRTFQRIPIWGICAGAILIAKTVKSPDQRSFGLLDMTVQRNAYGSQLNSFNTVIQNSKVSFIRAPLFNELGPKVQIKAELQKIPVWVQQDRVMATAFHPELSTELPSKMHKYFLDLILKSHQDLQ